MNIHKTVITNDETQRRTNSKLVHVSQTTKTSNENQGRKYMYQHTSISIWGERKRERRRGICVYRQRRENGRAGCRAVAVKKELKIGGGGGG